MSPLSMEANTEGDTTSEPTIATPKAVAVESPPVASTESTGQGPANVDSSTETDAKPKPDFEPIVLAFSCNWCSYTSADLAGVNRFFYPANVRIIRFMCSGRIEPDFILRAFENGADGVIVSGCKLGECHYITGNEKAQKRLDNTGRLLDLLGLGAERLGSVWISAAEGAKFASYMNEFVDKIRTMGPSLARDKH